MPAKRLLVAIPTQSEMKILAPLIDGAGAGLITCGIGPAASAYAITQAIERERPGAVILAGIAGAYEGAGLEIRDVCIATSESFGDLGRCVLDGIEPLVIEDKEVIGRLPLRETWGKILDPATLERAGIIPAPMATVSCTSGSPGRAGLIARLTGAAAENMEGAAAALVCAQYGLPLVELRGISNRAGDPDRPGWKIREALDNTARALSVILHSLARGGLFS